MIFCNFFFSGDFFFRLKNEKQFISEDNRNLDFN
jgi:hypothetical protein